MLTLVEVAVSVGVLATLITVITTCVCGCKNANQKSELVGTAGVVKLRFDEEAPSPTPTTPASVKRASTQNSQRSLPEIPHPVGRHDSGDTTSEIYATVNLDQENKAVPSSSSREHPYEHAYAKLQNENHVTLEVPPDVRPNGDLPIDERDSSQSGPESMVILASVAIAGQVPSSQELPYITPPAHAENVQHFSGDSTDSAKGYTSISVREPLSNIRANNNPAQPHYATVSDDSDEMYAAIDDPNATGSETYAQIAPVPENRDNRVLRDDPRRSLDRDQPSRNALLPSDAGARRSAPPEMNSTSIASHSRQASSSSATLAGASGATASVGGAGCAGGGSPRGERRRQADSPLPAPPTHKLHNSGDLHFSNEKMRRSLNEKHQRNNSCVSSSDFYGCNYPVDKHRYSSGELARNKHKDTTLLDKFSDNASDYSTDNNASAHSDRLQDSPNRNLDDMYAKVVKKSKGKDEQPKENNNEAERQLKFRGDDPGYETIDRKSTSNHGYETIAHKERKISQNQDPGYETVKDVKTTHYANALNKLNHVHDSGPNSLISSSDPGYEHINKIDNSASDSDPNYEVLRNNPPTPPYATIAPNYKQQPTYSTVNKKPGKYNDWNDDLAAAEPNYESMPHEPLYAGGSESDPNYESVRPKDSNYELYGGSEPNYESLRLKDPRYESVRSKASSKDPNYESVKYYELSQREPPYERLQHEGESSSAVERSDSNAGYERIDVPRRPPTSINNGDVVSDYFQV